MYPVDDLERLKFREDRGSALAFFVVVTPVAVLWV